MLTQQRLIRTTLLIEWAGSMSAQYRDRVERLIPAEDLISLEKETHIKSFLATLIGEDELKLLMKLLNDSNGKRWEPPVDGWTSKIRLWKRRKAPQGNKVCFSPTNPIPDRSDR